MSRYAPYAPRWVRFAGTRTLAGYRVKTYHVAYSAPDIVLPRFATAISLAESTLPPLDGRPERPGVGFLILHEGNGADYAVLCWWDRENELPVRVFVREQRDGAEWRLGERSESFCVWDLEVIWHERQAYVAAYLTPGMDDSELLYLANVIDVDPPRP